MSPQSYFLLINSIGGLAVLGSYAAGLGFFPEYRDGLWGGVRGTWKTALTTSMLFATAGYLVFCYFALFRESDYLFRANIFAEIPAVNLLIVIFLSSAALWMPTLITYFLTGNGLWWFLTLISLWITAIALVTLTGIVSSSSHDSIANIDWIAPTIGLSVITAHCLIADAIIWVFLFHR